MLYTISMFILAYWQLLEKFRKCHHVMSSPKMISPLILSFYQNQQVNVMKPRSSNDQTQTYHNMPNTISITGFVSRDQFCVVSIVVCRTSSISNSPKNGIDCSLPPSSSNDGVDGPREMTDWLPSQHSVYALPCRSTPLRNHWIWHHEDTPWTKYILPHSSCALAGWFRTMKFGQSNGRRLCIRILRNCLYHPHIIKPSCVQIKTWKSCPT